VSASPLVLCCRWMAAILLQLQTSYTLAATTHAPLPLLLPPSQPSSPPAIVAPAFLPPPTLRGGVSGESRPPIIDNRTGVSVVRAVGVCRVTARSALGGSVVTCSSSVALRATLSGLPAGSNWYGVRKSGLTKYGIGYGIVSV
jgi:hypothetical protein